RGPVFCLRHRILQLRCVHVLARDSKAVLSSRGWWRRGGIEPAVERILSAAYRAAPTPARICRLHHQGRAATDGATCRPGTSTTHRFDVRRNGRTGTPYCYGKERRDSSCPISLMPPTGKARRTCGTRFVRAIST